MAELSVPQQQAELLQQTRGDRRLRRTVPADVPPALRRLWNATTLQLLTKYQMLMVLWSVDTDDYELPGSTTIVHRVLTAPSRGRSS